MLSLYEIRAVIGKPVCAYAFGLNLDEHEVRMRFEQKHPDIEIAAIRLCFHYYTDVDESLNFVTDLSDFGWPG